MHKARAIVADREEYLPEIKSQVVGGWPDLRICGRTTNGQEALKLIEELQPELAFLVVRIPGICAMRVARRVGASCRAVFIATHDHCAVNAFGSGAVDYHVKPIDPNRLLKTIERVRKLLVGSSSPTPRLSRVVERIVAELPDQKTQQYLNWIQVLKSDGVPLGPVEEVCFFKSSDKYTRVVTQHSKSLIKNPVKELADELDPNKFWKIHRESTVNVA